MSAYEMNLKKLRNALREMNFEQAKQLISETLGMDELADAVQNLMGVYQEKKGHTEIAMKHYRAAYALNPTNVYAAMNVERLAYTSFTDRIPPYYGDEPIAVTVGHHKMKLREEGR